MVAMDGAGKAFGALLRRHRQQAALSQEQLAERAGLSADAVSALERVKLSRPDSGGSGRMGLMVPRVSPFSLAPSYRVAVLTCQYG
jgi:hypothetical protein